MADTELPALPAPPAPQAPQQLVQQPVPDQPITTQQIH